MPVESQQGLNVKIANHFARAPYFLFVTIKNNRIIDSYTKKNYFLKQEIQSGLSVSKEILKENIDAILIKKIGEISFHILRDDLISIYLTQGENANNAINNFIAGKLKKIDKSTHLSHK